MREALVGVLAGSRHHNEIDRLWMLQQLQHLSHHNQKIPLKRRSLPIKFDPAGIAKT